jgi:hypothetical protein
MYRVCRMDDPLIWGVLPFRYAFNPANHRWSLGSYDICFQNRFAHPLLLDTPILMYLPPDSCLVSSPTAKPSPRTAARTRSTEVFSNQLWSRQSASSPPNRSLEPQLLPLLFIHLTTSSPAAPSPTPRTGPTAFLRPLHTPRESSPGSISSPKAACTNTPPNPSATSNGVFRV